MTEAERVEIVEWLCSIYFSMIVISPSVTGKGPGRLRKQLLPLDRDVPLAVWRIRSRIVEREGLQAFCKEPIMEDLISIMLPGGKIYPHRDLNLGDYIHSRFNVFVQLPPGEFNTFYGGRRIEAVEGHYTLCRSGLDTHWSDVLENPVPRITLSFGFLIPLETVNRMYEGLGSAQPLPKALLPPKAPSPTPLEIENARLWAAQAFGMKWWYSGEYGKRVSTYIEEMAPNSNA